MCPGLVSRSKEKATAFGAGKPMCLWANLPFADSLMLLWSALKAQAAGAAAQTMICVCCDPMRSLGDQIKSLEGCVVGKHG